jgi:hypothetical protein
MKNINLDNDGFCLIILLFLFVLLALYIFNK